MNERIRQLSQQAFNQVWDLDSTTIGPGTHFVPDGFEQKFAELIVRECALTAGLMEHEGRKNIGSQRLDNFGVEQ